MQSVQLVVPAHHMHPWGVLPRGPWTVNGWGVLCDPLGHFHVLCLRDCTGRGELTVSIWTVFEEMDDDRTFFDEDHEWGGKGC